MKYSNPLIKGTFYLTLTGLITRIIGFFYRIFLSHTIGAEGVGIYQLVFPAYTMCYALAISGIQTALSRFVAEKVSSRDQAGAKRYLAIGLLMSLAASVAVVAVVFRYAPQMASRILYEERCAPLLKIIALSIPFGAVHSSISGYYYGLRKTAVPSLNQLAEQIARVLCVYLLCQTALEQGRERTAAAAAWGIVAGEAASMLFTLTAFSLGGNTVSSKQAGKIFSLPAARGARRDTADFHMRPGATRAGVYARNLLRVALPLTASKGLINVLQGVEAIYIPGTLRLFGLSTADALSVYGIFTGMAMPLILFPSALTNSAAIMLLPEVAQAQVANQQLRIARTVEETIKYCLIMGLFCTGIFLLFGNAIGISLFHSQLCGKFITILGWICPFLYLTTTALSIINGLGMTGATLIINVLSQIIRILFVFLAIPQFGIIGYLWGLLISLLFKTLLAVIVLKKNTKMVFRLYEWVLAPLLGLAAACCPVLAADHFLRLSHRLPGPLLPLCLKIALIGLLYLLLLLRMKAIPLGRGRSKIE